MAKYIPAGTHLAIISTSAAACSSIFRRSVLNCSSKICIRRWTVPISPP